MAKNFSNLVKSTITGAGETISNWRSKKKAEKAAKENLYQLAVNKARKKYRTLTNVDVTPTMVRDAHKGIIVDQDVKNYEKLRDQQNQKLRERFNIK